MDLFIQNKGKKKIGALKISNDWKDLECLIHSKLENASECMATLFLQSSISDSDTYRNCQQELSRLFQLKTITVDIDYQQSILDNHDSPVTIVIANEENMQSIIAAVKKNASETMTIIIPSDIASIVTFENYFAKLKKADITSYIAIFILPNLLKEMKDTEYIYQFAYFMKSAILSDAELYTYLLLNVYEIQDQDEDVLQEITERNLQALLKATQREEREAKKAESGDTQACEFGDIFVHALMNIGNLSYGECMALGCVANAFISYKKDILAMEEYYEIRDMFVLFSLPITFDGITIEELYHEILTDRNSDVVCMQVLKKIGRTQNDMITSEELMKGIEEIYYSEEDNE